MQYLHIHKNVIQNMVIITKTRSEYSQTARNGTEFRIWLFVGVHRYGRIAKGEKRQKSQGFDIPAIFLYLLIYNGTMKASSPTII